MTFKLLFTILMSTISITNVNVPQIDTVYTIESKKLDLAVYTESKPVIKSKYVVQVEQPTIQPIIDEPEEPIMDIGEPPLMDCGAYRHGDHWDFIDDWPYCVLDTDYVH